MVILGIDPGTATTGYGVIVDDEAGNLVAIAYGCVKTESGGKPEIRLLEIYRRLTEIVQKYRPGTMSVEQIFFNRNVTNALSVGQARGIALLVAAEAGIPVFEFTPLQVKQTVAGYGRADKQQIQQMVRTLLGLEENPKPDDVADALAVAICCAHARTHKRLLAKEDER